jgi:hypothetical protein
MRIAVAVGGGVLEELPATPQWSARQLHTFVEDASRERLGKPMRALLYFDGVILPATDVPLASLGLEAESVVGCSLVVVVQVTSCEPSVGPDAGGTMVRVHGDGFTQAAFGAATNARIGFGPAHSVPCWRISDTVLGCRAPAHAPATVSVRLLGCEAGQNDSDTCACFEFVRLEHLYDAIFASTNSYCPRRGVDDGAQRNDGGRQEPSSGDDSTLNENEPPPPPQFGF